MKENMEEFLRECAKKYNDATAFEIKRKFRREKISFHDVYKYSLKMANFLLSKGLKKGDRVLIWSPNMPEWVISYFGILFAGGVAVPIDFRTSSATASKFVEKTKPKLMLKSKDVTENIKQRVDVIYVEDVIDHIEKFPVSRPNVKINRNDLAEIVFTSGTTGEPKGVVISYKNIFADMNAISPLIPIMSKYEVLSILPLSHMYGMMTNLIVLKIGGKLVFLPKINSITIYHALQENQINIFPVVPQILRILLDSIERQVKEQKKEKEWKILLGVSSHLPFFARKILFNKVHKALGGRLEFFVCGSAPLDLKLAKTWENMGFKVLEAYGATEVTAVATGTELGDRRLGAVGNSLPGVQLKLSSDGEILVKGDMVSKGYYENKEKTSKVFRNGWYHTNDIGRIDDGYLHIIGRDDFKITLPNGMKVYPEDIEKKLNRHPLVWDSCVFGIERDWKERVHAVLVVKEKSNIRNIIEEINRESEPHQQIMEYSVWPEDDFPRTMTLKVDRKKVRDFVVNRKSFDKEKTVEKKSILAEDKLINIISHVTKANPRKINDNTNLVMDLSLDSLERVELVALIEEEMGVVIDEMSINPKTKVSDLRKLIKKGSVKIQKYKVEDWLYLPAIRWVREILDRLILFPLFGLFTSIRIENKENLEKIKHPSILAFNHAGNGDAALILKILPQHIRINTAIATMAEHWDPKAFGRFWIPFFYLFINVYPFARTGHAIRSSLETTGKFLDNGWFIMLAPEGKISKDPRNRVFKHGIGYIAVEMNVPVVPFKIEGYHGVIPIGKVIPEKFGNVTIKVGEPITFSKDTSYIDATEKIRAALESL